MPLETKDVAEILYGDFHASLLKKFTNARDLGSLVLLDVPSWERPLVLERFDASADKKNLSWEIVVLSYYDGVHGESRSFVFVLVHLFLQSADGRLCSLVVRRMYHAIDTGVYTTVGNAVS